MGDFDAVEVVRRMGGSADWKTILRHSTSHSIRSALRQGNLIRIARGTYALPGLPSAPQAAAAMRGLVSHRSAADHWLLDRLTAEPATEITVPRRARPRPRKGVTVHYADVLANDDHGGVTSPLRTVLDCAATLPFAEGLAIADSALRRDLITSEQLLAAAQSRPGHGRRKVLRVAQHADGRAANPFESALRAIVLDAGRTGFTPQLQIHAGWFSARVDLGDPIRKIVLEADSFEHHGSRQALVKDCGRYDELVRRGWLVLRFSWEHVMFEQRWVADVVLDTWALRNPARQRRSHSGRTR